jgi:hypothetical protein
MSWLRGDLVRSLPFRVPIQDDVSRRLHDRKASSRVPAGMMFVATDFTPHWFSTGDERVWISEERPDGFRESRDNFGGEPLREFKFAIAKRVATL